MGELDSMSFCKKLKGFEKKGEHTVKVLEVGQLDPLAHSQNIRRCAETVDQHPDIPSVQSRDPSGSIRILKRMFDIGPRGDDGAEHHQTKGEKGKTRHRTTEPQHLSVRNEDDSQVLEDGVNGDREELKRLGAGVNHTDQKQSNREPYVTGHMLDNSFPAFAFALTPGVCASGTHTLSRLVRIEITELNKPCGLAS